jgi:hypothetical protein
MNGATGLRPTASPPWKSSGDPSLDLAPDFNEFCGLLNAHHVEFVVVGAYALALHGAPRFTGDLDILVRPTLENGTRLLEAIRAFGFPTGRLSAADIAAGTKVVEMGIVPVQIHVMSQIDGVHWDDVWNSREMTTLGSHPVAFIGRDAFLRNKRAAGRAKDLADIEALGGSVGSSGIEAPED